MAQPKSQRSNASRTTSSSSRASSGGRPRRSPKITYAVIALVTLAVLGAALYQWLQWDFYWVWLLVINVVTFAFFRFDKGQAQRTGAMRVPEVVLLGLMVAGGVLGGAGGMWMRPRHKTNKPIFVLVVIISLVLHAYWLFRTVSV